MRTKILLIISVIGCTIGIFVHLLTYIGTINQMKFSYNWLLYIGFLIFLISIFKTREYKVNRNEKFDKFFNGIKSLPNWMKVLCAVIFIYEFANITISCGIIQELTSGGVPIKLNGKYALLSKYEPLRYIALND